MTVIKAISLLILQIIFLSPLQNLAAEPIYKWKDKDGVEHYSSVPQKGAKQANLPEITRGEVKIPQTIVNTCRTHSGIDCAAGADSDGSVVCLDGFRDSNERFNFSCSAPKLQIAEVSPLSSDGGFSVMIRNAKSVKAERMQVRVKFPDGETYILNGPENIEGFGVGEFEYTPPPELREKIRLNPNLHLLAHKPKPEDVEISCNNCP